MEFRHQLLTQALPDLHPGRDNQRRSSSPYNVNSFDIAYRGHVQHRERGYAHCFQGEQTRTDPDPDIQLFVPRKEPIHPENETMRNLRIGQPINLCGIGTEENLPPGEPRESLEQTYGNLSMLQSQYMSPRELRATEWHEDRAWFGHVRVVHNLLSKLTNKHDNPPWMEEFEMNHLLKMAIYEMEDDVVVLKAFRIFVDKDGNLMKNSDLEFGGSELLYMGLPSWYDKGNDQEQIDQAIHSLKHQIVGKRWLIAPINFQKPTHSYHWGMTVFDRRTSQLYVFDSMINKDSHGIDKYHVERIKANVHAWARFWDALEFPFDFELIVPEVTPQGEAWECGYLSAVWAMVTLRTLERGPFQSRRTLNLNLGARNPEPVASSGLEPSLHIADWTGYEPGAVDSERALYELKRFVFLWICNELGIPRLYSHITELQETLCCDNAGRSWLPHDKHLECDAKDHKTKFNALMTYYQLGDFRLDVDYERLFPVTEEMQQLIYAAQTNPPHTADAGTVTHNIEGQSRSSLLSEYETVPEEPLNEQEDGGSHGDAGHGDAGSIEKGDSATALPDTRKPASKASTKRQTKTTTSKVADEPAATTVVKTTRSGRRVNPPARYVSEVPQEPVAPKPKAASKPSNAKSAQKKSASSNSASRGTGTKRAASSVAKEKKPSRAKSKKRAQDDSEWKEDKDPKPDTSSGPQNPKKRKRAEAPSVGKSVGATAEAKKQTKAKRARR